MQVEVPCRWCNGYRRQQRIYHVGTSSHLLRPLQWEQRSLQLHYEVCDIFDLLKCYWKQGFIQKLACGCKSQGEGRWDARSAEDRGPKGREWGRDSSGSEGPERAGVMALPLSKTTPDCPNTPHYRLTYLNVEMMFLNASRHSYMFAVTPLKNCPLKFLV